LINKKKLVAVLLVVILLALLWTLINSISINNIVKSSYENKPLIFFTGKALGFDFLASMETPRKIFSLKILNISKEKTNNLWLLRSRDGYISLVNESGVKVYGENGKKIAEYSIDNNYRIISSFVADLDKPGEVDIILLSGKKGEEYGRNITILLFSNTSAEKLKVKYTYQFKEFDVWKVQVADVDGDKKKDISFGAYKKTPLNPVFAKRPFVFNWQDGGISPKWLGSRLSMPFDDYIFQDINGDGIDELISIEVNQQSQKLIRAYRWKGFGFEGIAVSKCFQDISDIKRGIHITGNEGDIVVRSRENNIWKWTIMNYNSNEIKIKKATKNDNLLDIYN